MSSSAITVSANRPTALLRDRLHSDVTILNSRCRLRREDEHTVVLVGGAPVAHFKDSDRLAKTNAMVMLVEHGWRPLSCGARGLFNVAANGIAACFGMSRLLDDDGRIENSLAQSDVAPIVEALGSARSLSCSFRRSSPASYLFKLALASL
jgi:hypothetical protein